MSRMVKRSMPRMSIAGEDAGEAPGGEDGLALADDAIEVEVDVGKGGEDGFEVLEDGVAALDMADHRQVLELVLQVSFGTRCSAAPGAGGVGLGRAGVFGRIGRAAILGDVDQVRGGVVAQQAAGA